MTEYRWYPAATTLEDGTRAIVLSGSKHPNHRVFGGRQLLGTPPTAPSGDSLRRFAPVENGLWDPRVLPELEAGTSERPVARERHTSVEMKDVFNGEVLFGGLDTSGTRLNDTFILRRYDNVLGSDYVFKWEKINPSTSSPFEIPRGRSEHTAVNAPGLQEMVMYGGLRSTGPSSDVFRFFQSGGYKWQFMTVDGSAPAGRYGHASCYEEIALAGGTAKRMLVFGGVTTSGGSPADTSVWALTFDPGDANHATWSNLTPTGTHPAARSNCTLIADPLLRQHPTSYKYGHVAYLFGGWLGGTTYSNELWLLWTFTDGTTAWQKLTCIGDPTVPSARARHAATFDGNQGEGNSYQRGRLYIFGGENSAGIVDKSVYVVDPWLGGFPAWKTWAQADVALTGHTMTREHGYDIAYARLPEIYNVTTNSWDAQTNSRLLQHEYPPTFVAPHATGSGTRIVSIGKDDRAYWLDVPTSGVGASPWRPFANGALGYGSPTEAVMYRPGKIMIAGGITDSTLADGSKLRVIVPGTTRTLNLSDTTASWQTSAPMQRRNFHNLVLLPDGKVLAIGGTNTTQDFDVSDPVRRPQIWDPDGNGGVGTWTAQSELAEQGKIRNYHSTAILLPDGRVLSTSGHQPSITDTTSDPHFAELYCPPYLFDASGNTLAPRPTLRTATGRMRYGSEITFSVQGDTAIRRACLIRSPATTHGFDQSQRYVPISIERSAQDEVDPDVRHYFAKAPPDSATAPPGDYMLFVSNAAGVPAIAQWVRVGPAYTGLHDSVAPDTITIDVEFISSSALYPFWYAPGDDGNSGTALDYDLRWSLATLNATNFGSASRVPSLPIPWGAGALQRDTLSGLNAGTWYHFANMTRDKALNWSALSADFKFKTLTGGGGGGGLSARRVAGEEGGSTSGASAPTRLRFVALPNATLQFGSHVRLVAEFVKGDPVRWTIRKVDASADRSLAAIPSSQLAVQIADEKTGWRTRSAFTPGPGALGVRSLAGAGRVVFPEGVELDAIETAPVRFATTLATHSRLGDLTASVLDATAPELTDDDVVTLDYSPRSAEGSGDDCFFTVLIPGEAATAATRGPLAGDGASATPGRFAFHPVRPNPFQSTASLRFSLDSAAPARFEIFDAGGRRVRVLAGASFAPGEHELTWDGRDTGGARVRPGIYLARLVAGSHRAERKIALMP